jgi:transketolase
VEAVARGGYTLSDSEGTPDLILIGTGGELHLCALAAEVLRDSGVKVRVVSLPCWELFDEQDAGYREAVLPAAVKKRLAVEAGSTLGWHRFVTDEGDVLGVDTFGASAPGNVVLEKFGFTVENVIAKARAVLG